MQSWIVRTFAAFAFATAVTACGGMEGDDDEEEIFDDGAFDSAYEEGKEDAVRAPRFEIYTGNDGKYYFQLVASNGQKTLQSQGYTTTSAAKTGIKSIKSSAGSDANVELKQSSDDQWYFVVKGGNGAIVGVSEMYVTKSNAQRALDSVRKTAPTAGTSTLRATATASFQVFKGLDNKYYFHVRAKNGEILVQSQSYSSRASAVSGSTSVATNAETSARYEIRDARDGQSYFVLKAANGAVIAVSELYSSRSNATRARDALIALFKTGTVKAAK